VIYLRVFDTIYDRNEHVYQRKVADLLKNVGSNSI
jgi:hypothetical protein